MKFLKRSEMEKVRFDDVLKYEQPTKYLVSSENYSDAFEIPVLTAGKSFLLGYTDENNGIFENVPVIIFDDFTTSFHYVDFPFKVKSSALKILKNIETKADLKYLFYKMRTINFKPEQHKRYWISKYTQFEIPLPSLSEQKAIAAKLDKADEIRRLNQQLIDKYDDLTQSLFIDMFGDPVQNEKGWEYANGEEYSKNISVGVVIKPASHYVNNGIIALRSLNVKPNNIVLNEVVYFSEKSHNTVLSKSKLNFGDVVVVRTGNTGTAAIVPKELDNCNCIDLIIVRPNANKINSKYLVYFLNSNRGKEIISGHEVGGIQKHFNVGSIKKIQIPLPPISLQNQFAERIAKIEAQKQLAQDALAKSEALFQSLLQESFK